MRLAVIGAGSMGSALARGLARGPELSAADLSVSNPSPGKLEALAGSVPGIRVTRSNAECAAGAGMVVLAVKPWKLAEALQSIAAPLRASGAAVCSMAGGVTLERLAALVREAVPEAPLPPLYRLIPNTAIGRGESMTFLASLGGTPALDALMERLLRPLGDVMAVEERLMDAATALASCGIAYALRYARAATEGGVELGLSPAQCRRALAQTLRGAAALLDGDGAHPEAEIDRVTTPGGLTIRGLNAMERRGFSAAVIDGLLASVPRDTK